jgi:carboxyl-terminal processing protease
VSRTASFVLGWVSGAVLGAVGGIVAYRASREDSAEWDRYRTVRDFAEQEFVRGARRDELADDALRGMLGGLDRYSKYYDAAETAAMERETGGRYRGIGVVLKRPVSEGRVLFTLRSSPAERGGLRVGDRLLEVEGRDFTSLTEAEVREALSRDSDAPVRLRVRGFDGVARELAIVRESVVEPTVRGERMLDETLGIGYFALHSFSGETAGEFDAAFQRLSARGLRGLVLDLRGNGGGVLQRAIDIANRFIAEGDIAFTEGRTRHATFEADPTKARYRGFPLVVLVDEESASASEVLAGALQDHRAAVVVGMPTWGKGTVQTIRRFLDWGTAAKVTTSFYYTPSHRNLEHGEEANFGIAPDVLVETTPEDAQRVRAYLARPTPNAEALAALRAWEAEERIQVVEEPPADAQLAAATELLRGHRPRSVAGAPAGSSPTDAPNGTPR